MKPISEDHRQTRMMLGAFALGDVTAAEAVAVRAHLDGCAECRAELAALTPLVDRLATVDVDRLDDVPVTPPELEDRVFARLERARSEAGGARSSVRGRTIRRRALLAVACVAAAAIGFAVAWTTKPGPAMGPREAVAVRSLDRDVRDLSADVVPHTWGMEIKLVGSGFDAGATYDVNVITASGRVEDAGEFIGVGDATMDCNLNSSVLRDDATGFEVVDEAGAVVATSSL